MCFVFYFSYFGIPLVVLSYAVVMFIFFLFPVIFLFVRVCLVEVVMVVH